MGSCGLKTYLYHNYGKKGCWTNGFGVEMIHAMLNVTVNERGAVKGKSKCVVGECGDDAMSSELSAADKIRTCAWNVKDVSK